VSFLGRLDPKYRLILCDVWGVVHNGVALHHGAEERLRGWRGEGRFVVLLTNAPRTEEAVAQQLAGLGLPDECWDAIVTSGEAGIAALNAVGAPVGFIGTRGDRDVLEGKGVRIAAADSFTDLGCTGLREGQPDPHSYRTELEDLARRGVLMHCLNPDRVVIHGRRPEACAGALADIYEAVGGRVTWYGKPFPAIYEHALARAGNPPGTKVLAIGDGLQTDMFGAARMGFDAVFVSSGIHEGEPILAGFAAQHRLGPWRPVAVVDGLD
jgi:HAD superfamily hydrolase (TIGR01459 family)